MTDFVNAKSDPATTPSNAEKLRMFRDEDDDQPWDMPENTPEAPAVSSSSSSPAVGGSINDDKSSGTELSGIYVQGMNVIAAPFLYAARSEAEAFVAFERFMLLECPGYVRGAMDGVHRGVAVRLLLSCCFGPPPSLKLGVHRVNDKFTYVCS